jgi:nitrate/TMAO reductase-like tetraheme cytochrome c subunit|tara:strand:+ start:105 stop:701 length:597 start_codon:yes stop_codon:yes gene_type:complete
MIKMFKRIGLARTTMVILAVVLFFTAFGLEPATRFIVAKPETCFRCHDAENYDPFSPSAVSRVHPADSADFGGQPALCVDCHVPKGMMETLSIYTHFSGVTDLFGNGREKEISDVFGNIGEEDKEQIDPDDTSVARKAYRVREAMLIANSSTCRTCHVEDHTEYDTKPVSGLGQSTFGGGPTCIECHYNLVHRQIDPR